MRDARGGDHAGRHPALLRRLEQRAQRLAGRTDADRAVVGLHSAGVGRRPGRGVGHEAVRGARARGADEQRVEREPLAGVVARHRATGRPEAVRDHQDHVARALVLRRGLRASEAEGAEGQREEEGSMGEAAERGHGWMADGARFGVGKILDVARHAGRGRDSRAEGFQAQKARARA